MNPSDSRLGPLRFRCLIRTGRWPPHLPGRVSSTGQSIFENMPTLLPRESMDATSVVSASTQRPSPSDHRVGFSSSFTRLRIGSLAFRPALLLCGNSRPRIAPAPLPHATKAYGQLLGRDFNPLDTLLLLRTVRSCNRATCPSRASGEVGKKIPPKIESVVVFCPPISLDANPARWYICVGVTTAYVLQLCQNKFQNKFP